MIISVDDKKEKDEEEKDEETTTWKSCCFLIDKAFFQYTVKMSVIVGLMIFSGYNLMRTDIDCPEKNYYVGLITLLFGVLVPNPKM